MTLNEICQVEGSSEVVTMGNQRNIEEFINNKLRAIDNVKRSVENKMAKDMAEALGGATSDDETVSVTQEGNVVRVFIEEQQEDIIDLKTAFRKSPKKRESKDGGWHLVVPIRRYTGRNKKMRESSQGMTSRMYKDLLSNESKSGYKNIMTDYLYDNRRSGSPIPELNYQPKGKTITRLPNPAMTGRGHIYISFRTVSDKSHPASWIINRNKIRPNNKTQEVRRIIDEVRRYQFNKN